MAARRGQFRRRDSTETAQAQVGEAVAVPVPDAASASPAGAPAPGSLSGQRADGRAPVQRRLLALDGGGIRGAFTLGVLGELETMLAETTGGGEGFVLADYFDFIGGTSTGAIIASGLSLGWSVDTLKEKYRRFGDTVFRQRRFPPSRAWSKYPGRPLQKLLHAEFGDRTFGSTDLRTRLMIVAHNRSTDSPWPLVNEPKGRYNDGSSPTRRNLDLPLWRLLSASTAAPSFFPPVHMDLGAGDQEFVDGGVTAHNNPALQMLLAATLPEYRMVWPTGADRLLLVSVGTGSAPAVLTDLSTLRRHIIYVATSIPSGLMFAAANHNDVVCRAFAETRFGPVIDRELGDMIGGGLPAKMFAYARYNVVLSDAAIALYGVAGVPARELARLDGSRHVETLLDLGRAYGREHLSGAHFAGFTTRREAASAPLGRA